MNWLLFALAQILIVGLNVEVSEGAPVPPTIGSIRLAIPCGSTASWENTLERQYQEKVIFKGVSRQGLMKFYANSQTSTFTVAFETEGMTCIIIAGNFLIKETERQPL